MRGECSSAATGLAWKQIMYGLCTLLFESGILIVVRVFVVAEAEKRAWVTLWKRLYVSRTELT